jgi:hypothetical protein
LQLSFYERMKIDEVVRGKDLNNQDYDDEDK